MAVNATFASPTADAKVAHQIAQLDVNGVLSTVFQNLNGWTLALTVLLACVVYDQCASDYHPLPRSID
jgi:C-22 sterol desaturase